MNTEEVSNKEENSVEGGKFLVPGAILGAGALIAIAVLYSGGGTGGNQPGAAGNLPIAPGSGGALVAGGEDILKAKKGDYVLGNPSAKVTIIEYGDFQCPFCKRLFDQALPQLKEEYIKTGKAKLIYRHFPLNSIHPEAQKSAEASECAGEQEKFWEMHDILYERQDRLSQSNYRAWAGELGLNQTQFNECLDSGKYAQKVADSFEEGRSIGVSGTPATFINSTLVAGAQPFAAFKEVIEKEL